jgi:dolichol kinase
MAWDFKKEVRRKLVHLLSVFFIIVFVVVSTTFGKRLALFALVLLLLLFIEMDYVRVELGRKIPIIGRIWRKKETGRHGAQVFFLIGAIISLAVFDFNIALAAILMTTFGDMAAALIGKRFGSIWIAKERALEGILAEFIVDFAIAYILLDNWIVMLVMSLTATIVESMIYKLDDNLIIPVFSGFNGQLATYILSVLGKL